MSLFGRIGSRIISLILRRPGDFLVSRFGPKQYVHQNALLILTDINPNQRDNLTRTLEDINTKLRNNPKVSFHNTKTIHYAAWMIIPGLRNKEKPDGPPKLAFETNYDGKLKEHLADLVNNCLDELNEVYGYFTDYPVSGRTWENVSEYSKDVQEYLNNRCQITDSRIDASAYYVALPGRSVKDIKNAIEVYYEAKNFVDELPDKNCDPTTLQVALLDHFRNGAKVKPCRPQVTQNGVRGLFVLNMTVVTLLLPFTLLYLGFWFVLNFVARFFEKKEERRESKQKPFDPTCHGVDYAHLDLGRQNHLCSYVTVSAGCFRMFVLRCALWLGTVLFNYFFILGKLDQISTVHFARWMLIDRQLLFYGNYDGNWSSYLSDFSDEAWGVNLIWGNTIGFPRTKFLIGRGARDLEGFQSQAVTHYAPAPLFFSAYGSHSLVNILRYLEFRDELVKAIE